MVFVIMNYYTCNSILLSDCVGNTMNFNMPFGSSTESELNCSVASVVNPQMYISII